MDELRNFANQHAGIASIFNLGKSYEGREQQAIKVKIGWIAPIGEWIMNVLKYKRHNYFLKNRTNLSWVGWFQNVNIKIKYDLFQENGVPKFFSDKKKFFKILPLIQFYREFVSVVATLTMFYFFPQIYSGYDLL